ncbi:MAG: MGH1-like glycoside hydrolase domain-containing protein [Acidimicrobiales bacterium]
MDAGDSETTSGRCRTLEAMLPLLTGTRPEAVADLADPTAFAGRFGPRGVHPDEPAYEPARYWRGGVWPPLAYLLWVATSSRGEAELAASLASSTRAGAEASGLAEYWDPDTGTAGGSAPQSWSGVVLLMS